MIQKKAVGFALLTGLGLFLAGCDSDNRPSYTYKYKITVAVRDHGELLTASNVVRVFEKPAGRCRILGLFEGSCMGFTSLCGEATALKVRNGLYLFAQTRGPENLMRGKVDRWRSSPTLLLLNRLGLPYDYSRDDSGIRQLAVERAPVQLTVDEMPQFSVLTRFNDPRYVSGEIDPEHLPVVLGDEIKLESVTLQVTDDDVTRGRIAAILPWLNPFSSVHDSDKWNSYRWRDYFRCDAN